MTSRGLGAGDELVLLGDPRIAGTPVLLVNPLEPLSTRAVFAAWRGDRSRSARRLARRSQRSRAARPRPRASDRRRHRLARRNARGHVQPHVWQRGDLLRLVHRRGRARCRRRCLSRSLVASGVIPALRRSPCDQSSPPNECAPPKLAMTSPRLMERAGAALAEAAWQYRRPDRDIGPVRPGQQRRRRPRRCATPRSPRNDGPHRHARHARRRPASADGDRLPVRDWYQPWATRVSFRRN